MHFIPAGTGASTRQSAPCLATAVATLFLRRFPSDRPRSTPMFTLPYTARARACGCSKRCPPEGDRDERVGPRTVAVDGESLASSLPLRLPSFLVYDRRNDVTSPRAPRCVCKQAPLARHKFPPFTPTLMTSKCRVGYHFHFALLACKVHVSRPITQLHYRVQPVPRAPTY